MGGTKAHEQRHLPGASLPVHIILKGILLTIVLTSAALWAVWQPHKALASIAFAQAASTPLEDAGRADPVLGIGGTLTGESPGFLIFAFLIGVLLILAAVWGSVRKHVVRYVEERAKAVRQESESETMNIALLSALPDTIYLLNRDGTFLDLQGHDPPQHRRPVHLVGETLRDTLPRDVAERALAALHRSIRGDGMQTIEYLTRESGAIRHYEARIAACGGDRALAIVRDITDREQAQEQLRVLGMAVEQSAEGVLVIDTSGVVCFVNPAWAQMHGYDVDEVTGSHFRIFHTEQQLRKEVFPVINRFEKASIYRAEMGHKRKDGTTFTSSTAFASLRDDDGRVIGAVGICRDITDQKQYEAELLAAKEYAEELSRVKSAFLTNMSHEIRTPLTGILGFAKILEEEVPQEQAEFAHMIQLSGDRLLNTLNSILDLARLEAGEVKLSVQDVDLTQEVRDAASVFHAVAKEKRIDFDLRLTSSPVSGRVDPNLLGIVLSNLIGNAVKFTDDGKITVEMQADDEYATVTVVDTGIGIEADFLPNLFEEFKQESDGLARKYEGSGLGLSITKRLVKIMHGHITVESTKGEGSRFVISFPRFADAHVLADVA